MSLKRFNSHLMAGYNLNAHPSVKHIICWHALELRLTCQGSGRSPHPTNQYGHEVSMIFIGPRLPCDEWNKLIAMWPLHLVKTFAIVGSRAILSGMGNA